MATNIKKHSWASHKPRPGGMPTIDGRLAYDIVEAAGLLAFHARRAKEEKREAAKRLKRQSITLPRMPWD